MLVKQHQQDMTAASAAVGNIIFGSCEKSKLEKMKDHLRLSLFQKKKEKKLKKSSAPTDTHFYILSSALLL